MKQKFTGNGITAGTLQDRDVGRNSGHKFSRFINIKKGSIFKNKAIKDISPQIVHNFFPEVIKAIASNH